MVAFAQEKEKIMQEKMKKIGREMAVWMGLLMSFCLSLTGTLTSGHFTPVGFLLSFAVSLVVSLIIGFLVPMGRITGALAKGGKLLPGRPLTRVVESLISDVIYTPLITLVMVFLAYNMAMKMSGGQAQISFWGMFLPSLGICFAVGFVLIFIFQPLLLKAVMKKHGVTPGGPAGAGPASHGNGER